MLIGQLNDSVGFTLDNQASFWEGYLVYYLGIELKLDHISCLHLQVIWRERQGSVRAYMDNVYHDLSA